MYDIALQGGNPPYFMSDGFSTQDLNLYKNIDILLITAVKIFTNGKYFNILSTTL